MSGFMLSTTSKTLPVAHSRFPRGRCGLRCKAGETSQTSTPMTLLFGSTAAALLWTMPVEAGVILPQPSLKKIEAAAPAVTKAAKSIKSDAPVVQINIDIGSISLPLTLAGCIVLYLLAQKLDTDFDSFMDKAWLKDSAVNGVGYEPTDKSTDYLRGGKR